MHGGIFHQGAANFRNACIKIQYLLGSTNGAIVAGDLEQQLAEANERADLATSQATTATLGLEEANMHLQEATAQLQQSLMSLAAQQQRTEELEQQLTSQQQRALEAEQRLTAQQGRIAALPLKERLGGRAAALSAANATLAQAKGLLLAQERLVAGP